ncbi:50S ribosomal protein L30e [Methanococcus voltae]|jgi:large subunit ribosomal protein L30e|uniref:Large ribosomal subunit protein eL30 n=1 Tax=Methanococcus voltae (strain ATCC BAA-1334 / A3) TaxID=456320 RepID=D7DU72_METV3|nr:50S ribosomal protein L30e [Methanococcus voltae]MCS3900482.1 large subunit ribosomal protein L30e [Methanococcus voltae]
MDINRAIRVAVDTGKVVLGTKQAVKNIKHGEGQLLIVAGNCAKEVMADLEYYTKLSGVKLYVHDATSLELGAICGKPFPVSALVVMEPGNSSILNLNKE